MRLFRPPLVFLSTTTTTTLWTTLSTSFLLQSNTYCHHNNIGRRRRAITTKGLDDDVGNSNNYQRVWLLLQATIPNQSSRSVSVLESDDDDNDNDNNDDNNVDIDMNVWKEDNDDDDNNNKEDDNCIVDEITLQVAQQKQNEWLLQLQHLARTSRQDVTAITQGLEILDDMLELYVQTNDSTLFPNVQVYNFLLEAYAYSKSDSGADEALKLLQNMEDIDNSMIARPNAESYVHVMDAFAMRHQPEQVLMIMKRQQEQRYTQLQEEANLKITVDAYNKLIKAYGIAGNIQAAETVFRSLTMNLDDDTNNNQQQQQQKIVANHKSWIQIMKAYLSQENANQVEAIFQEMKERYERTGDEEWYPCTQAYNVLIRAKAQQQKPKQAESILYDMMDQFRKIHCYPEKKQIIMFAAKPNADTFRHVILAYTRDRKKSYYYDSETIAKLDQLLQIQDSFLTLHGNHQHYHHRDDESEQNDIVVVSNQPEPWQPDDRLYNLVLDIVARSQDHKKATRAKKIVERFRQSKVDVSKSTLRRMYYSILLACAYSTRGSTTDRMQAFEVALNVYNEVRRVRRNNENDNSDDRTVRLDSSLAGMFLKVIRNIVRPGPKRDQTVQQVFEDCCNRGIVNEFVLQELGKLLPGKMQLQLLGGYIEDGVQVNKQWKRNV